MFKRVLVGIDGEAGGRDALMLARRLLAADGELIAAHVKPLYPVTVSKVGGAVGALPGTVGSVSSGELDGVPMVTTISTSVGRGLHLLAEHEGADLLVVGSTRHGLIGRVLAGNDTNEAINGAPCALAVAPAGYADRHAELRRIGVAYNDSPESERALQAARDLATASDAKLSAMEVATIPTSIYYGGPLAYQDIVRIWLDEAREHVESLEGVEPHAVYGNAGEELAQFSGKLDLLVVGSRGYGPVGRLIHGSVSRHLARASRCPLLIVTRSMSEDAGRLDAVARATASVQRSP